MVLSHPCRTYLRRNAKPPAARPSVSVISFFFGGDENNLYTHRESSQLPPRHLSMQVSDCCGREECDLADEWWELHFPPARLQAGYEQGLAAASGL